MEDENRSGELRVGIIGAGVSGLAACKHCSEKGFNATVFEGKSGLGGVWRASYSSTKLQSPKRSYEFSDFPWPEAIPTFPSHHQVVNYLESYARHFGCLNKIRFNSQVVEVVKKAKPEHSLKMGTSKPSYSERVGVQGVNQLRESLITESQNGEAGNWDDGKVIWEVCVRKQVRRSEGPIDYVDEWHTFDFLIMCCGRFGDVAKLPSFPESQGPDVFNGQVLHALDYSALDSKSTRALIRGKKVVVVGFQKTSIDIAVEVAEINQSPVFFLVLDSFRRSHLITLSWFNATGVDYVQPCTLLFRRAHWMFPRHRKAFGLFPLGYLFGTRFSSYWTSKPGQDFLQRLLQRTFTPLKLLVWQLLEYYLRFTVPVGRYGLVPEHSLFHDISACVLPQVPQNLLQHLEDGHILPKKSPNWHFYAKGLRLANGTRIEADVVILCTGYDGNSKLKAILPEDERAVLFEPQGVLTLYRGIIHPQIPNMGFVGYVEGLSSVYSAEMAVVWLVQLLQKRITLPDVATMETERRTWLRHWKYRTPFFARTCACVATTQIWHTDKLCKDMGFKPRRKKSVCKELFSMYSKSDYKELAS